MKKFLITLLAAIFLSGCLSIPRDQDPPFYASKELFVACQVADVGTTWYALHLGAVELNPLGFLLIGGIKLLAIILRYKRDKDINEEGGGIVLNVIACAPVVNNVLVIKKQMAINKSRE